MTSPIVGGGLSATVTLGLMVGYTRTEIGKGPNLEVILVYHQYIQSKFYNIAGYQVASARLPVHEGADTAGIECCRSKLSQ